MPRRVVILLVALGVGAICVAGLFTHGWISAVLLALTDVVLIALTSVTWPRLRQRDRAVRVAVVVVIAVVAAVRVTG
jgi:hypothetical protein